MNMYVTVWIIFSSVFCLCECQNNITVKEELIALRSGFAKTLGRHVPPITTGGAPIQVNISLGPVYINDLDTASQTLDSTVYIVLTWNDPSLTWAPTEHSNISQLQFDYSEVWTPYLLLANSVGDESSLISSTPIIVFPNGMFLWQIPRTWLTSCKMDISRYPFDQQSCDFFITSVRGYLLELYAERNIDPNAETGVRPYISGQWEYLGITQAKVGSERVYPSVQFTIGLRRKYIFHLLNLIFPMVLFSFTNCFVFLLPASSGEKMGFLMAVFVSNALFLTLIHDAMPPTSDAVPSLSIYLTVIQVAGFITIAATIAVQIVYHKRKHYNQEIKVAWKGKITPVSDESSMTSNEKFQAKISRFNTLKYMPLDRKLDAVFFGTSLFTATLSLLLFLLM